MPATHRTETADTDPAALRAIAETLARDAGQLVRDHSGAPDMRPEFDDKSSATDLVTEFDRLAEHHIVSELARLRPGDGILAEEGAASASTTGTTWVIDPIDGTTNFVYGLPTWSTSVAAAVDGITIAGAVYAPALDEMYSAARGAGASLNGHRIGRTSSSRPLETAIIATGFTYRRDRRIAQAALVGHLLSAVGDIRRLGSAALDLCLVAAGRVDAYVEEHLNSWDVAAGLLIATEAGAQVSDFSGAPATPSQLLVCDPHLHAGLLEVLAQRDLSTRGRRNRAD